ncbi:hypothetical protein TNCV_679911 [Trichonephila clavipes]|nr:hypothetical protein TNCV_679911 [Trichonephila clavipes]
MTLFQTHDYLFQNSVIETSICKRFEHMETVDPPLAQNLRTLENVRELLRHFRVPDNQEELRLAANQHLLDTMGQCRHNPDKSRQLQHDWGGEGN